MSYTTLYATKRSGKFYSVADFSNSWLGAMHVWTTIAQRYRVYDADAQRLLHDPQSWVYGSGDPDKAFRAAQNEDGFKKVWALWKDPRVSDGDHYVLLSTFDRAVLPHETALIVAHELRFFSPSTSNLAGQADTIERLAKPGRFFAWNQTSVSQSQWQVHGPHGGCRPYDLNRDTGHFFIEKRTAPTNRESSDASKGTEDKPR